MKQIKLNKGQQVFVEVDPLFPEKYDRCGQCGRVVLKESMRFIAKLGRTLCEHCRKEECEKCGEKILMRDW